MDNRAERPNAQYRAPTGMHVATLAGSDDPLKGLPKREVLDALLYTLRAAVHTEQEVTGAWLRTSKAVSKHIDGRIEQLKAEIDSYTVFAGIFAVILAAFIVESLKGLSPSDDSSESDSASTVLRHISAQLGSFSLNPPFFNSSQPPFPLFDSISTTSPQTTQSSKVTTASFLVNVFFFASLMCCLCSAFAGTVISQWLKAFYSRLTGDSRLTARLRQHRLKNIEQWHVGVFVHVSSYLLLFAIGFFLLGLAILLWPLSKGVLVVICVFSGLVLFALTATTLLPLFYPSCAYVSPLVFGLYYVLHYQRSPSASTSRSQATPPANPPENPPANPPANPPTNPPANPSTNLPTNSPTDSSNSTIRLPPTTTWQEQELRIVLGDRGLLRRLDLDMLYMAYQATLDPATLGLAAACLMECSPADVVGWFKRLDRFIPQEQWDQGSDIGPDDSGTSSFLSLDDLGARTVLWTNILRSMIVLDVDNGVESSWLRVSWKHAARELAQCITSTYGPEGFKLTKRQADWVFSTVLWMMLPEPIEFEGTGKRGEFPPPRGAVAMTVLVDALHGVLHCIVAAQDSGRGSGDAVISHDVAEFAAIVAYRRFDRNTQALCTNTGHGFLRFLTDWFSSACAVFDGMTIVSQGLSTESAGSEGVLSQLHLGLLPHGISNDRPKRLDAPQFRALRKQTLSHLNKGLRRTIWELKQFSNPAIAGVSQHRCGDAPSTNGGLPPSPPIIDLNLPSRKLFCSRVLDQLPVFTDLLRRLGIHSRFFDQYMPEGLANHIKEFTTMCQAISQESDHIDTNAGAAEALEVAVMFALSRIQFAELGPHAPGNRR
ncbi:hypothetical protein ACG7TL_004443 [Trametes sanguinea]